MGINSTIVGRVLGEGKTFPQSFYLSIKIV